MAGISVFEDHFDRSCISSDMAEISNETKNTLQPTMHKVAANDAHAGCGNGDIPDRTHS